MGTRGGGQVTGTEAAGGGVCVKLRQKVCWDRAEECGLGRRWVRALAQAPRVGGAGQGIGPSTPTFTQTSYKPDDLNSTSYSCRRRWE